jgi:hypothetical protein
MLCTCFSRETLILGLHDLILTDEVVLFDKVIIRYVTTECYVTIIQ